MKKAVVFLAAALAMNLAAAVKLPAIFSDHAVLARSAKVPVFGKADPGEKVTVEFNKQKRSTVAGKDGKWRVDLDLANSPEGPFELKVNNIVIKDVLVGEVWLCSGQSNMAFTLEKCEGYAAVKAKPAGSRLRSFNVWLKSSVDPVEGGGGRWVYADPQNVGQFSGVAYFFGAKLLNTLNRPVGLIKSAWGGSPIETWMRIGALKASVPATLERDAKVVEQTKAYPGAVKKYVADLDAWAKAQNRQDTPRIVPAPGTKWSTVTPPRIPGGVTWLRRTIEITPEEGGKKVPLNMARLRVGFTVWCDGKMVAEWPLEKAVRNIYPRMMLPAMTPGKHEIMLRFYNPLSSSPSGTFFSQPLTIGKTQLDSKPWECYQEKKYGKVINPPKDPGKPPRDFFNGQRVYNGSIAPFAPYGLNGVIWYQGETNSNRHAEYAALQRGLVKDWREVFEAPELPFFWCNLPNFYNKTPDPSVEQPWALFRAAQSAALDVPFTGEAILIDVGEANDIHPINKTVPGERLAALALAKVYGKKLPFVGPEMVKVAREGNALRITFKNTYGGLVAAPVPQFYHVAKRIGKKAELVRNSPGTQLEGFALCGKEGKWFWADKAVIEGDCVVVSSSKVAEPCRVRYAWQSNPTCNLYNKAGFPARAFMSK